MINKLVAKFIQWLKRIFYYHEERSYSEEEQLIKQIKQTQAKLEHAWQNLEFAMPEYIDIAILEIYGAEVEYTLLLKKLRMLLGELDSRFLTEITYNPRFEFAWLASNSEAESFSGISAGVPNHSALSVN